MENLTILKTREREREKESEPQHQRLNLQPQPVLKVKAFNSQRTNPSPANHSHPRFIIWPTLVTSHPTVLHDLMENTKQI